MIQEQAKVISIEGDHAIVEINRQSGCQSCELSGACGTGSLGRLLGHRQKPIAVPNRLKLKSGDKVLLRLPEQSLLISGFMVYLLPLIFLFGFAMLTEVLFNSQDWLNVVSALVGLFSGFRLSSRLLSKNLSQKLEPQVDRLIG